MLRIRCVPNSISAHKYSSQITQIHADKTGLCGTNERRAARVRATERERKGKGEVEVRERERRKGGGGGVERQQVFRGLSRVLCKRSKFKSDC